jgi:hypothetical protein
MQDQVPVEMLVDMVLQEDPLDRLQEAMVSGHLLQALAAQVGIRPDLQGMVLPTVGRQDLQGHQDRRDRRINRIKGIDHLHRVRVQRLMSLHYSPCW